MTDDAYRNFAKWYDRLFEPMNSGLRKLGFKLYRPSAEMQVLDVGCGSGILSFSCCLFGARKVVGTDISPEAISVAETNTSLNSFAGAVTFSAQALSEMSTKFDLVIANGENAVRKINKQRFHSRRC